MDNEQGWQRLAAAVRRRREERGWTQLEVATRGGISIDRIQAIEGARTDRYAPRTLTKIERGLDWVLGSCRATLDGGDPTPIEAQRVSLTDKASAGDTLTAEPTVAELAQRLKRLEEATARHREENAELRNMLRQITGKDPGGAANAGGEQPERDEPRQAM